MLRSSLTAWPQTRRTLSSLGCVFHRSLVVTATPGAQVGRSIPPLLKTEQTRHLATRKPPLKLEELTAIGPIDGRYGNVCAPLRSYFSEFALIKRRAYVEIKWLLFLAGAKAKETGLPPLTTEQSQFLDKLAAEFSLEDARRVKEIEGVTRHDLKAVEYFLKEALAASKYNFEAHIELLHFAITSEDVNNIAYALMVQEAMEEELYPAMQRVQTRLRELAHLWSDVPLLGRTHGQPATPTTVGKEMANFAYRLNKQITRARKVVIYGKINGAVGNFNAKVAIYPDLDWPILCDEFLDGLKIKQNPYTTQIEPHDWIGELFDALAAYNTVLLDCARDMWGYISRDVFKQPAVAGEIGSSTMPHKVNPIDFENAEGNVGLANAIFKHMAAKLPVSRFQRDLSDSTVLRNMGVGLGFSLMAYHSAVRGLHKIDLNRAAGLEIELDSHWEVLAEPIQTVMRRFNVPEPYEKLKELTRGKTVDRAAIRTFIFSLEIPEEEKKRLLDMTPANYIGVASSLAKSV
eukprot:g35476.t1